MGVREAGARLRFQLVRGDVLGLERQGLGEVACEVGGLLARDAVDEIERDVVNSGITKTIEGAPDVVRLGNAVECPKQTWRERLRAERHAVDAARRRAARRARASTVSGFASTVTSSAARQGAQQARERAAARSASACRRRGRRSRARRRGSDGFQLELAQQRVDVAPVLAVAADDGDEVAVAAARRAERQVDVEVTRAAHDAFRQRGAAAGRARRRSSGRRRRHRLGAGDAERALERADARVAVGRRAERRSVRTRSASRAPPRYLFAGSFRFSTARNASCGTSTPPTLFIRFLPFFCFSSSLRLRVMSPP